MDLEQTTNDASSASASFDGDTLEETTGQPQGFDTPGAEDTEQSINGSDEQAPATGDSASEEKVPWHQDKRWQDWQQQKQEFERLKAEREQLAAWQPLIEQAQQAGFNSVDEFRAFQEQQAWEAEQARIEAQVDARVESGEIDPYLRDKQVEYDVALARIYRIEMNNALKDAQVDFPGMDGDLIRAFADKRIIQRPEDVRILAQHTHERIAAKDREIAALKEAHVKELEKAKQIAQSEYAQTLGRNKAVPTPEGPGGTNISPDAQTDDRDPTKMTFRQAWEASRRRNRAIQ